MNKSEKDMNREPDLTKSPKHWEKDSPEEKAYREWCKTKEYTGSKYV